MSRLFIDVVVLKRLAAGLTQKEAAVMAGVSLKTYQRIENGETDIKMRCYERLLKGLNLTYLDVCLDCLGIEGASGEDVAAAARLLPPKSRLLLIKLLISTHEL